MTRDSPARKYTWHGEGGGIDVCKVVQSYTSHTAKRDHELRYCEFGQIGAASKIRIMVTTTALSAGLNIPDIGIVVQWKFPITKDLEDAVQRLGRVGRLPGLRLQLAYMFVRPRGSAMNWEAVTPASLVAEIPALESWRLWAREQHRLVDRLRSMHPDVESQYAAAKHERRQAKLPRQHVAAATQDSTMASTPDVEEGSARRQYEADCRARDDALAMQVALRRAREHAAPAATGR